MNGALRVLCVLLLSMLGMLGMLGIQARRKKRNWRKAGGKLEGSPAPPSFPIGSVRPRPEQIPWFPSEARWLQPCPSSVLRAMWNWDGTREIRDGWNLNKNGQPERKAREKLGRVRASARKAARTPKNWRKAGGNLGRSAGELAPEPVFPGSVTVLCPQGAPDAPERRPDSDAENAWIHRS
eukprot:gene14787-biopygen12603